MTDKEILDRLWEAHRETPFATFSLQRKLDLRHDALRTVLNLINDMADSGEVRSGYRIKRVASTMYKLISQAECDSDSDAFRQPIGLDLSKSQRGVETAQAASTAHKATQAQPSDSDTVKGKLLIDPEESLTGANTAVFDDQPPENAENGINDPQPEPLERFSFFARGDNSGNTDHTGNIEQLHRKLTTDPGWRHKIEQLRALTDKSDEQKLEKKRLPALTASIRITRADGKREGIRNGDFEHTNLIQADFDKASNFDELFEALCRDPHARLVFRSSRGKVKAFIKVAPVATIHDHRGAWNAVEEYCRQQGYGVIDGIVKPFNSLCYISHDTGALLKNASPLNWEPLPRPTQRPTTAPTTTDSDKPSTEQVREMLSFIPADDYEVWLTIGCALRREEYDFSLWDAWSQKSVEYGKPPTTADKMPAKWESFQEERDQEEQELPEATLGTIYHHAQTHGWQPPPRRETYQPHTSEQRRMSRRYGRRYSHRSFQ